MPRRFGSSGSLYGLGYIPVPPYYALHPPVYYGERYYRSYGESPFARVDHSSRPRRIQAQVIINPFVVQPAAAPAASEPTAGRGQRQRPDQVTVGPQMIINPYYVPEAKVAYAQVVGTWTYHLVTCVRLKHVTTEKWQVLLKTAVSPRVLRSSA